MTVTVNSTVIGIGGGIALTSQQLAAGATGVIASDASGNAYKQDGTAFSGGGSSIPSTTAILKGNGAGAAVAATAGTDYAAALPTTTALLKGNNAGGAVAATAGTDYVVPSTVAALQTILLQCGVLVGIAPSGTIGANGAAFTSGTAFTDTYSNGIWLYFPAAAIDTASAAGFYWVVMSSVTAGQIFQNTYTPGTTTFAHPGSTTPFTTNTGSSYTGVITQITAFQTTIPANAMGPNGAIRYRISVKVNNSAGTKTAVVLFGGASSNSGIINTTTSANVANQATVTNAGTTGNQSYFTDVNAAGSSGTFTDFTTNTTLPVITAIYLKLAVATDWVVSRFCAIELAPAA